MSNVIDLTAIRLQREEAANKIALKTLLSNLDQNIYRSGPEDKYFELRLRDAVLAQLHAKKLIRDNHGIRTTTVTFVVTIEKEVKTGSREFDILVEEITEHLNFPIGYLHSVMVARQSNDWSIMVRYYSV